MITRTWGILALVGAATLAVACSWDRDTLATEAKGLPDVIDVIGGRFDRNPNLYYEMRLERTLAALEKDPNYVEGYGDAAVALDKLGRGTEAIELLEDRLERLHRMYDDRAADGPAFEHAYQLYANLGTARVHDWFRRGAPDDDIEALEQAISEIESAIEINPDAHFGREFVQLHLMKLLLIEKQNEPDVAVDLARNLHREILNDLRGAVDKRAHLESLVEGAVGMIVMGGGWESPDMYAFLAGLLTWQGNSVLADLALKRSEELVSDGGNYLFSQDVRSIAFRADPMIEDKRKGEMVRYYDAAKAKGEEHKRNRDSFMLAKLLKGEHPDTHDDFWDGYEEVGRINYTVLEARNSAHRLTEDPLFAIQVGVIAFFTVLVLLFAWAGIRRIRAKAKT